MRLLTLCLPSALFVSQVVGAVVATNGGLSRNEILQSLTENPNLLPKSTRQIIAEKTRGLSRRGTTPPLNENLVAILGSIFGAVQNFPHRAPKTNIPTIQESPSPSWPGAKRRKLRYGPYRIPPKSEETFESRLLKVKGMINTMSVNSRKPCDDDCVILSLEAGIEHADGKAATTSSGSWLHHAVLLNIGTEVSDAVCGGPIELIFATGNERTSIDFALHNGTMKTGYHIQTSDTFLINTELMNMDNREKWVWLHLTFDYVDGFPQEYKDARVIWMSIGPPRCGGTDVNPFGASNLTALQRPTKINFEEYSIPWKARRDGQILGSNAHMHDGGTLTEVYKNHQLFCSSTPHYSASAGGMSMGGHKRSKRQAQVMQPQLHIDSQSGCEFPGDEIPLKKGDRLYLRVEYDFTKYPGMKDKSGDLDKVMGMTGSLVAYNFP
jgi:hypothetical protein